MTVREFAQRFKVSTSTVYRRIRNGLISAVKVGRRWRITEKLGGSEMGWGSQVDIEHAKSDGRRPGDFRFEQWAVSNVRLHQPRFEMPKEVVLTYRCDIPADTPQANQYDESDQKIPDPKGMCLAHVDFRLINVDTMDVLDEALGGGHVAGDVRAFLSGPCRLWHDLKPGRTLKVRLFANPEFFFLNEQGGMVGYANTPNGQFVGKGFRSGVHILSMDHDGNIFVDGEGRPAPPLPEHEGLAEYERLVAAEEAERKRIEREMEARLAREKKEREERWAREDREREEENRRALAKAEAERKRNEPYIQRGPGPTKKDMLMQIYEAQFEGLLPDGDEQFKDKVLRKVMNDGDDWRGVVDEICRERGWTL